MKAPLTNLCILNGSSAFDIKRFACKTFNVARFVRPFSFGHWHDLKIVTSDLALTSLDYSSIISVLVLYPQCFLLRNECVSFVVEVDIEILRRYACVILEKEIVSSSLDREGLSAV